MAAPAALGRGVRAALLFVMMLAPLHATTFYLTVAGLGGEPDYETRFHMLADETDKLLQSGGTERVVVPLEGPAATKQALLGGLSKFAQDAKGPDSLVLMLIGHGTFDGTDYKI